MLVFALCLSTTICAHTGGGYLPETAPNVRSAFPYVECGLGPVPLPVPIFGIGYRGQYGYNGFDVSLNASTVIVLTQIKGSLLYHYYPKPCVYSQFYYGAGVSIRGFFDKYFSSYLSPEFVVGKSYLTDAGGKRFFQMDVSWLMYTISGSSKWGFSHSDLAYLPLITFTYGIGF